MNVVSIRKCCISDIDEIYDLINSNSENGRLMEIPRKKLVKYINDFIVAIVEDEIVGCCAMHHYFRNYYELRSLSVKKDSQGNRIGEEMINRLLENAKSSDFIFIATMIPEYGKRFGFVEIKRNCIPLTIWVDKGISVFSQKRNKILKIVTNKYTLMRYTKKDK